MKSTRSGDLTPARVLQIVDALEGGGAERVVVDLVKHIDRDKYAPLICTTREPGVYAPEVEREGIPV